MTPALWCLAFGLVAIVCITIGYTMGRAFGRQEGLREAARYWTRRIEDEFRWSDPDNEEE